MFQLYYDDITTWLQEPSPPTQNSRFIQSEDGSEQCNGYIFSDVCDVFRTFNTHKNLPQNVATQASVRVDNTIRH